MQARFEHELSRKRYSELQFAHKQEVDALQFKIDELDSALKGLESYRNSKQKTDEELELLRKKYDDLHTEFTLQKNYLNKEHMLEIEKINKRAADKQKQISEAALMQASQGSAKQL
jgi:hypothetical protein